MDRLKKAAKCFAFLAVMMLAGPAFTGDIAAQENESSSIRAALVIGNSDYASMGILKNAANDAEDLGDALDSLGFDVELLMDADLYAMEDAVVRLRDKLAESPDSIGFFFFAGHGVQSGGENYLIPADARIGAESLLKSRALPLRFVLDSLEEAENELNVIALDACRDNPFAWAGSGSRGLSVAGYIPPGCIVAYAAEPDSVADESEGRNGIFAEELVENLMTPGIDIGEVFRWTEEGVAEKTSGTQFPAIYSQYSGTASLASEELYEDEYEDEYYPNLDYLPEGFDEARESVQYAVSAAEEQASAGQWLSAWYTFGDPELPEGDPYILAEKIRLCLDGYVYTDQHLEFGFVDLEADQDLETARDESPEGTEYFDFDPLAESMAIEDAGTDIPAVLALALGDYFYDVWRNYPEDWILDESSILDSGAHWYERALSEDSEDSMRLGNYAELLMASDRAADAIAPLARMLELEPDDRYLEMRLVSALVDADRPRDALELLDGFIENADSPESAYPLYDEYLRIAYEAKLEDELSRALGEVESDYPDQWLAGMLRIKLAFREGLGEKAEALADELIQRFPGDMSLLVEILDLYLQDSERMAKGFALLDRHILQEQGETLPLASLLLIKAAYRYQIVANAPEDEHKMGEIELALEELDAAEEHFKAVAEPDDDIFGMIAEFRAELEKAISRTGDDE
jgi:hypothetical protein